VQQSHADIDAALHAARVGFDALLGAVFEVDLLEHLIHAVSKRLAGEPVHLPPEIEVFERSQVFI